MTKSSSPLIRFLLGILAVVAAALAAFYLVMHPPMAVTRLMALLLALTAGISAAAGYAAYRLGWLARLPSLGLALVIGYALASVLTFLNVWITARLMFASPHDLELATILLLFAGGIAIVLGSLFASSASQRLARLEAAAGHLAEGDLSARAPVEGRDEIARLATAFNDMAARLEAADLQQKELAALRRDLVAWASHDLQTPLAAIQVQIEALADGLVEDEPTRQRYLHSARRSVRQLSLLIDDLFQVAQIDAGGLQLQREPASLADLFSDTLESFSALAAQNGVSLAGSVDGDVDPLLMDARRIARVLDNLVGNALRHTPPGGQITLAAARQGGQVSVTVQDSGAGISSEDLPFVFERFYRGEKSRSRQSGGAGLGLVIARGIVEAHGGQISAESPPGGGARFTFTLPD